MNGSKGNSSKRMFTGIIEEAGRVAQVVILDGGVRLRLECSFGFELRVDESVSVNGVCLTVVDRGDRWFEAVAIEETLLKSSLGSLKSGSIVNLERAMRPTGRLDGHIVQGHVDTVGTVADIVTRGSSSEYAISFDPDFGDLLIPKGSITLDGISLTIASIEGESITVAIIPHTTAKTNVSSWKVGSTINIEFDMIGKYVVRYLDRIGDKKSSGISREWMREQGF